MQRCEGVEVSGEVWHKKHLLHQYFLTAVATLHVFSRQKHPQFLKALTTQPGPRYTTVCTASLLSDPACMAYDTTPSPHRTAVIFWCKAVVDGSGFALTRLPACRADFHVFIFNFSAMCWICTPRKRSASCEFCSSYFMPVHAWQTKTCYFTCTMPKCKCTEHCLAQLHKAGAMQWRFWLRV